MRIPLKVILGMDEPPCKLVARELVKRGGENPDSPCVVVVPTREAARLLKEQLAIVSAGEDGTGAFVSPRIVQASQLVGTAAGATAPACVSLFVWLGVLRRADARISLIFPKTDDWREEAWLHAAGEMQKLFHTLALEGVDIGGEAWQRLAAKDNRWEVLLTLWQRYLERLQRMGLADADAAPVLQLEPNERVILACVPGLSRQAELLLAAAPNPVEVWIPCEEPYAGWFDAWGRPGRQWLNTTDRDELGLSRPDWKKNLIVTGDAWALAAETARATARANAAGHGALHAVGLGVCDPGLEPAIAEEFALHGVATYRPQGIPFSATSWQRVLEALAEISRQMPRSAEGSQPDAGALPVAPLTELLRQPVITRGLDIPNAILCLQQLKEIRAKFLPDRTNFLLRKVGDHAELKAALDILLPWLGNALVSGENLLQALRTLAEAQPVEDDAGEQLATGVRDACTALLDMGAHRLSLQGALLLLNKQLGSLAVRGSREGAGLAFNGWMELLYSPAERLVIAGMHDKQIPERWPISPLLTRAARQELGVRSDDDRAARDAFLLRSLLGSRRPGNVCFTFALTDIRKDPAAPSPLLFTLSPRNRLPELVAHFFGKDSTRKGSPSPGFDISGWHYQTIGTVPCEINTTEAARYSLADFGLPNPMAGKVFSPSVLADFLNCPLRFWIKRVRHIDDDDADDERETLQQRNVGDCLHRVLELFVRRYPSWEDYNAAHPGLELGEEVVAAVETDLQQIFRDTYEQDYGNDPLLPQKVQRDNMAERLSAYAPIHVDLWKEGWHTARDAQGRILAEYQVDWMWMGHPMRMKVDRVDERIGWDGRRELRIIDYKTGKVESCSKKHLVHLPTGGVLPGDIFPGVEPPLSTFRTNRFAPNRWVELQLPIYVHWAVQELPPASCYNAAYICLDRKPGETRVLVWGESAANERDLFSGDEVVPSLMDNAAAWAKACMDAIAGGYCLVSIEQLGWGAPRYDIFGEATEHVSLQELFMPETRSDNH